MCIKRRWVKEKCVSGWERERWLLELKINCFVPLLFYQHYAEINYCTCLCVVETQPNWNYKDNLRYLFSQLHLPLYCYSIYFLTNPPRTKYLTSAHSYLNSNRGVFIIIKIIDYHKLIWYSTVLNWQLWQSMQEFWFGKFRTRDFLH